MICLAALAILATITLPSLILTHPHKKSKKESTVAKGIRPVEEGVARMRYEDLLVREAVHTVEKANPDFWLASSKQWLADQVTTTQLDDFLRIPHFSAGSDSLWVFQLQ